MILSENKEQLNGSFKYFKTFDQVQGTTMSDTSALALDNFLLVVKTSPRYVYMFHKGFHAVALLVKDQER